MELAELFADVAADVIGRTELEIQQLEELEAFNSLRLPVEDTIKTAIEVLVELASKIELVWTEPEV